MNIEKKQLKILNYLYRKPRKRYQLLKKFKKIDISNYLNILCDINYLSFYPLPERDSDGFYSGNISDEATYSLTPKGRIEVESNQFFDLEYVISHILVPILVGVSSSVIAALIIS